MDIKSLRVSRPRNVALVLVVAGLVTASMVPLLTRHGSDHIHHCSRRMVIDDELREVVLAAADFVVPRDSRRAVYIADELHSQDSDFEWIGRECARLCKRHDVPRDLMETFERTGNAAEGSLAQLPSESSFHLVDESHGPEIGWSAYVQASVPVMDSTSRCAICILTYSLSVNGGGRCAVLLRRTDEGWRVMEKVELVVL